MRRYLILLLAIFAVSCGLSKYASVRSPRRLELLLAVKMKDEKEVKQRLLEIAGRRIEEGDIEGALGIGRMIKGSAGTEVLDKALQKAVLLNDKTQIESMAQELGQKNAENENKADQIRYYAHSALALADIDQKEKGALWLEKAVSLAKDLPEEDQSKATQDLGRAMARIENAQIRDLSQQLNWKEGESPLIYAAESIMKKGNLLAAVVWAESMDSTSQMRAFYRIIIELIRQKRVGDARKTLERYWQALGKSPESKTSVAGVLAGVRCLFYLNDREEAKKRALDILKDETIGDRYQVAILAKDFLRYGFKQDALEILKASVVPAQRAADDLYLCEIAESMAQAGDLDSAKDILEKLWEDAGKRGGEEAFRLKTQVVASMANIGESDRAMALIEQTGDLGEAILVKLDKISDPLVRRKILSKFGLAQATSKQYIRLTGEELSTLEEKLKGDDAIQMLVFIRRQPTPEKKEKMLALFMDRLLEEKRRNLAIVLVGDMVGEDKIEMLLRLAQRESDDNLVISLLEKAFDDLPKLNPEKQEEYLLKISSVLAQKEKDSFSPKGEKLKEAILKKFDATR